MKAHKMEFNAGDTCLTFDGKRLLKGGFAAMMVLHNDFQQCIAEAPDKTDAYIADLLYRLSHVYDRFGHCYDVIISLRNGKVFEFFPLAGWLVEAQTLGRKVMALQAIVQLATKADFADVITVDVHLLVQQLTQAPIQRLAQLAQCAERALSGENGQHHLAKPMKRQDPLAQLDLQEEQDYLRVYGHEVRKGSVGSLLVNIQAATQNPKGSPAYYMALNNIDRVANELKKLGFFDFFSSQEEWQFSAKRYPIMATLCRPN